MTADFSQASETKGPSKISNGAPGAPTVLCLGYDRTQTRIIEGLQNKGCCVWHAQDKIHTTAGFDLVVSFGYRHILRKDVIGSSPAPIVNLHISYLPYNRGAHPNFWSFFDGTPSGVSIHLIDEGVDTGPIIVQKYVNFSRGDKTFEQTYRLLILEIEDLFLANIDTIASKTFEPRPQRGKGTYHRMSDLPKEFAGWDSSIDVEVRRLDSIVKDEKAEKLKLIDEIERIRTANNVNWMDLLRLAFNEAPDQAKELIKRINSDDRKISELFSKLGE